MFELISNIDFDYENIRLSIKIFRLSIKLSWFWPRIINSFPSTFLSFESSDLPDLFYWQAACLKPINLIFVEKGSSYHWEIISLEKWSFLTFYFSHFLLSLPKKVPVPVPQRVRERVREVRTRSNLRLVLDTKSWLSNYEFRSRRL